MKKLGIGKFENQVRARTGGHVATLDPRSRTLSGGHPRGIPASRLTPPPSLAAPRPRQDDHDDDDDDAPGTAPAPENAGAGITKDAWCPPDGWIEAPPQGAIVRDVFVPSKAPLSDTWHADGRVPDDRRYGPNEALAMAKTASGGRDVELVVDLTNSSRYYDPKAFDARGCSYVKIACVGKDAPPDAVAVQQFVYEVGKFLSERAARGGKGLVLVHCTHGFNRTGAMLVHFAQRTAAWPKLNENLKAFAAARPPGIYKPEYVKELFDEYLERRFSTTLDPPVPEWKRGVSLAPRPGSGATDELASSRSKTTADGNLDGTPMRHDDVLGTAVYEGQAREIRNVVCYLCGVDGARFPGSQPVSLARDNMDTISRHEYHVTWKADGTRYMVLLMRDGTYLIDRKFEIRRVTMRFPAPLKTHGVSVHNATLLDGEMVVDDIAPGRQRRRFLAYDCVALHGERLGERAFVDRLAAVQRHVVDPRNVFLTEAGKSRAYDFTKEPFSVRVKDFTPLAGTENFIRSFIPKLCHECDGLIFQPSRSRYESGTMDTLLKWKFTHLNSVDFRLKLSLRDGRAILYFAMRDAEDIDTAGGFDPDVAPDGTKLADLDGKIVECTWDKRGGVAKAGAWKYLRVRTDKDAPNFVTVYRHTLASILDDITDAEIISYVGGVLAKGAGGNRAPREGARRSSGGDTAVGGGDTAGGYESTAPAAHVSGAERQQPVIDDI
ncbi:mRNA capping enzyme [Micromonas commoda]|uniref:mRNA guanylyltransferase n=1 Tax=Micromonas commoda (strain RCC299 / NOUM17 / CCMP2709) TaxID=296587 RepID=C1EBM5_MICCC|nr:mRNA capping enzyme [Micromonas commoda]ACO65748.1 mRNA capping enzyme [Micromonas commoda]|eukprot:XP_002504490.1 mRNA capping enzyme [Micromonas commoda]